MQYTVSSKTCVFNFKLLKKESAKTSESISFKYLSQDFFTDWPNSISSPLLSRIRLCLPVESDRLYSHSYLTLSSEYTNPYLYSVSPLWYVASNSASVSNDSLSKKKG